MQAVTVTASLADVEDLTARHDLARRIVNTWQHLNVALPVVPE